ncbi:hypothetical protein GJAV_G00149580, partial [Gymnothorax javanicus]
MANLVEVSSSQQFEELLTKAGKSLSVVHFYAPWAEQCGQMNDVMAELAAVQPQVTFIKLEAEGVPEVSEKYEITAVPTFLFFKNCEKVDRLDGARAPDLTKKVQKLSAGGAAPAKGAEPPKEDLNSRLKKLINAAPCMLFMKGSPQEQGCVSSPLIVQANLKVSQLWGWSALQLLQERVIDIMQYEELRGFSRQIVQIMKDQGIKYSSFDILSDEDVRQGLKTFSNWPTYPQVYVNGELLGGLDIIKEMVESGELAKTCPKEVPLEHRLKSIINRSPVMLFMKGDKEVARCGFSRQMIEVMNGTGVDYDTFDILQDEEVRQGLKAYSKWPTYPQLYVKGELIGGLDIVQ